MQEITIDSMTTPQNLSLLFKMSMWWRIAYGVLRIILGITLLKHMGHEVSSLVHTFMSHEITGKTTDAVLGQVYRLFETHDFTVTYFIAGYFIFWGIIDIILSFCLLKHIRSVFPISMALVGLFICYSIVRLTFTHSLVLFTVILIDIGILYLITIEYARLKKLRTPIIHPKHPDLLPHQS